MKHLKSILQQQEKMLQLVHQACGDKLSDCVLMVPDFEEKIISQMRWGLFMPERVPGKLLDKVSSTYRHTSDDLLRIDFDEICLVQDFIKSTPELMQKDMFSPKIPSLAGKALAVDMDYEELNFFCDEVEMPKSKASVEEILDVYDLRLTLPDYDFIFTDCTSLMDIPQWKLEYIDLYEQFKWDSGETDYYVQIGGHGKWIQGSYPESYIAQVNNDVGDAGSVYIQYTDRFDGWVDMH